MRRSSYRITGSSWQGARALRFDMQDIVDCVLELGEADFHKSMPSTSYPGRWQDVYRTHYLDEDVYLKLQVVHLADDAEVVVIVSFKER
jgi:hypothetical protein